MARSEYGSIENLGNGRYRVRVSAGRDPITGRRVRLSRTVKGTRKEALAELLRMQVESGDAVLSSEFTLAQFVRDIYLPHKLSQVRNGNGFSPYSYDMLEYDLLKYVVPGLGHIKLGALSPYAVEKWLSGIDKAPTRRKSFERFRTVILQAAKWKMADSSIIDAVSAPPRTRPQINTASPSLLVKILDAMRGERIEPFVLVMSGCGLRLSEACALNWEDVDFLEYEIDVDDAYHRARGLSYWSKTKTPLSTAKVSMPALVGDRLMEIRDSRGAAPGDAIVPTTGKNSRCYPHYAGELWREAYRRKLPDEEYVELKNLRHTHATLLLEAGEDIALVSRRLRHSGIGITAALYAKPGKSADKRTSGMFDSLVRNAMAADDGAQPRPNEPE